MDQPTSAPGRDQNGCDAGHPELVDLRPLADGDEAAALAAHAEMAPFEFLLERTECQPWSDYVARLAAIERGEDLPPARVPATFRVAVLDGELAGRTSIRHELTDWLLAYGGHIGYGVRPGFRRRGLATALLRASLEIVREQGVDRALLTCSVDNLASASVIERCGGVLEDVVNAPRGRPTRRYWVPTA